MTERHVHEELSAWLDGELDARRGAEVESHLASCDECASARDALRGVDRALQAVPLPEATEDRLARLRTRLTSEATASAGDAAEARETAPARRTPPKRARGVAPPRPSRLRWAVVASAAAALGALYLVVGRGPGVPDPGAPPPIARVPTPEVPEAPARPETPSVPERAPAPEAAIQNEIAAVPEAASEREIAAVPEAASEPDGTRPTREPEPVEVIAEVPPQPGRPAPAPSTDVLDAASAEELAMVLELETVRDLEVIANLELLEAMLDEDARDDRERRG